VIIKLNSSLINSSQYSTIVNIGGYGGGGGLMLLKKEGEEKFRNVFFFFLGWLGDDHLG
jgi:hypothetical protein